MIYLCTPCETGVTMHLVLWVPNMQFYRLEIQRNTLSGRIVYLGISIVQVLPRNNLIKFTSDSIVSASQQIKITKICRVKSPQFQTPCYTGIDANLIQLIFQYQYCFFLHRLQHRLYYWADEIIDHIN